MDTKTQRKYALIKIKTGDYLLPGNDGRTLWRLAKGEQPIWSDDGVLLDGSSPVWELFRWRELIPTEVNYLVWEGPPIDNWEAWEYTEAGDTRQEILDRALEMT